VPAQSGVLPVILGFLHLHPIRPPSSLAGISCTPSDSICGVHVVIQVLLEERPDAFNFEFATFFHLTVTQKRRPTAPNGAQRRPTTPYDALRHPTTPYEVCSAPPTVELFYPFVYLGNHIIGGRSMTGY